MDNCIFCKIIKGEIPAFKIYEDESVLAFLDIKPVNPGHVLLLPKKHFATIEDADTATLEKIGAAFKIIGSRLKERLNIAGYNTYQNNGEAAGQEVPHLHWHFIPRQVGDGLELWHGKPYGAGEAEKIYNLLK